MNDNDHMNKTNLITKGMPNYQSKYSSYNPIPHSAASVANFKSRPPEVSKERLDYEDSLFSDLAKDIKAVQIETNKQLQLLIEENRKSEPILSKNHCCNSNRFNLYSFSYHHRNFFVIPTK